MLPAETQRKIQREMRSAENEVVALQRPLQGRDLGAFGAQV